MGRDVERDLERRAVADLEEDEVAPIAAAAARSLRTNAPVRAARLAMVSLRCVSDTADTAVS